MSTTNPAKEAMGVGTGNSLGDAAAKLLESSVPEEKQETIQQSEPEPQESPEVETPEAEGETVEAQEPESEEGDAAPEDSDVEVQEEEDKPEAESKEPHYHTIKYDGTEYEVTLDELKKGYQLQKDYTQKTQGLAERRQEVDALAEQLNQEREKYIAINDQLLSQKQSDLEQFKNIDWSALRKEDPMGYIDKMAEKQEVERQYVEQRDALEAALTEQQRVTHEKLQEHLASEQAVLAEVLPEYVDPVEGDKLRTSISAYAATAGYSNHEIANVVNARDLVVLNKARLWDELQSKKADIREKKAPEKSGIRVKSEPPKSSKARKRKGVEDIKARARSSGKRQDAAAALAALMES